MAGDEGLRQGVLGLELGRRGARRRRFAHRRVLVEDEAEGRRLAGELASAPGWEAETTLYMAWRRPSGREPGAAAGEARLEELAALRAELIGGWLRAGEGARETTAQLLERDRRVGLVAGDRWFAAPAEAPAATCRLQRLGGLAQIEDVGTLPSARGRGLAQAVVLAALAAAEEAGDEATVIAADADDWPLQLYAKLGFDPIGEATLLRRLP